MAYKEGVAEALERISKLKTKKEKINALRNDHSKAMEAVVDLCFNPNIVWSLPEGRPPFKSQPKEADLQSTLYSNVRKFHIFLKTGKYPNLRQIKREEQFISFLESLDPDDAELIISIKDRKMPFESITKELFKEAWPALYNTWKK